MLFFKITEKDKFIEIRRRKIATILILSAYFLIPYLAIPFIGFLTKNGFLILLSLIILIFLPLIALFIFSIEAIMMGRKIKKFKKDGKKIDYEYGKELGCSAVKIHK